MEGFVRRLILERNRGEHDVRCRAILQERHERRVEPRVLRGLARTPRWPSAFARFVKA